MLKCSGCRYVSYCCVEHQRADRPYHAKLCTQLGQLRQFEGEAHKRGEADAMGMCPADRAGWRKYIMAGLRHLRRLNDGAQGNGTELAWIHQAHCQVCFSRASLLSCRRCGGAHFCSEAHRRQACAGGHDVAACDARLLHTQVVRAAVARGGALHVPSKPRDPVRDPYLPAAEDWNRYFVAAARRRHFDVPVEHLLAAGSPTRAMLSEGLSAPLTILRALEATYGQPVLEEMCLISVHILGAEPKGELNALPRYDEIILSLPACCTLELVFIGPNAPATGAFQGMPSRKPDCTRPERLVTYSGHKGTYHDFARGSGWAAPTICLAQHSGLHDKHWDGHQQSDEPTLNDLWEPTVQLLARYKIPSVFTAHNRFESAKEAPILEDWGARIVEGYPRLNEFRSLNPQPEWNKSGEHDWDNLFYAVNQYVTVVHGATRPLAHTGSPQVGSPQAPIELALDYFSPDEVEAGDEGGDHDELPFTEID